MWINIPAKFEDLLNTSAFISKQAVSKGAIYQDYQPFGICGP